MRPAELVQRFYDDVWNRADEAAAHEVPTPDLRFRDSLGSERHGVDEFLAYMQSVHAALGGYTCRIEDLIEAEARAAARVRFAGQHQAAFFGVPATGRLITWTGAAFFECSHGRIAKIWVLGDIDAVKQQLGPAVSQTF
jgi:steroid delta-isomerase-like uncharacterized protein